MAGVVTDNRDPDGLARVRVRLPWYGEGATSFWARLAVPMAGDGRGTYFLPEVDDEVLVIAEAGDPSHLYVIGSLWNGKAGPPVTNDDGKNNERLIHSRSGHRLRFVDDEAAPEIDLELKDGAHVRLDKDGVVVDAGNGNSISIGSVRNHRDQGGAEARPEGADDRHQRRRVAGGQGERNPHAQGRDGPDQLGGTMGQPAARVGDQTSHGTPLGPGPGSPTVLIGGMPAWRAGSDVHTCPLSDGPKPHVGGVVAVGSATVLIGGLPAARQGDQVVEASAPNVIAMGAPTVLIG